jgi:hypothetical protein
VVFDMLDRRLGEAMQNSCIAPAVPDRPGCAPDRMLADHADRLVASHS